MRYVGALYFLFCLLFSRPAHSAPQETVKFTPLVKVYVCPPNFQYRSDCTAHEKPMEAVKLVLDREVLDRKAGQWALNLQDPVPSAFYVIVVRGRVGGQYEYSVSTETGLLGSPSPFSNARVEFRDASTPASFGVSSATMEKDGKKYLTEIRLTDFHGKPVPTKK